VPPDADPDRPRVLLVDDDASMRRLVTLALEDLPLELVCCADAAEARQALAAAPADLVLSDLMLPGEHGAEFLDWLATAPERRGARLAVLSAGLESAARRQLDGLPLHGVLLKPVSVARLRSFVEEALGGPAASAPSPDRLVARPQDDPASGGEGEAEAEPEALRIARDFGGDEALYRAWRASCLAQFPLDVLEGDRAAAAGDLAALRRLGHGLKAVLAALGWHRAAAHARALELEAAQAAPQAPGTAGGLGAATAAWARLREALQQHADRR
jgi:CheY-like chemotaxis protein